MHIYYSSSVARLFVALAFLYLPGSQAAAQTYQLVKTREAQLHVDGYKQLAIGDIAGPLGAKTERSLDLADALTSRLFNAHVYEVFDRNTLAQILASQKRADITVIDDKTISALAKKLTSAFLITGRLQTEKIDQQLYSQKNGTCPGNTDYQWVLTGEVAIQLKVLDVKTGAMLFSGPVKKSIQVASAKTCDLKPKLDQVPIVNEAFEALADEIAKLVIPYVERIPVTFKPATTLFKNPLKKLNDVVAYFNLKQFDQGLAILKAYAEDKSLKPNVQARAHYNYALGLFCVDEFDKAKAELQVATSLDASDPDAVYWYDRIEKERQQSQKVKTKLS